MFLYDTSLLLNAFLLFYLVCNINASTAESLLRESYSTIFTTVKETVRSFYRLFCDGMLICRSYKNKM